MNKLQEKLDFLLEKYDVRKHAVLSNPLTVAIDGKEVPLLPWRNERRFVELRKLVNDGTLKGVSALRICRIEHQGAKLTDILYRELDLCEWLLGSEAAEIFTVASVGVASNSIVKLKSGAVCTIEIAATLSKNMNPIDKHEIIAERGVASDRVVDTQIPQHSVYVFGDSKDPVAYTDVDFELYGLTETETSIVRQAFEASKSADLQKELGRSAAHVKNLVETSEKSKHSMCNVILQEELL